MAKHRSKNFFKRFWDAFWRPEMLILPGQVAFFLFLSIVPTITLIGYACTYLNVSNDLLNTLISNALGSDFAELLTPILTSTSITPAFFITLGVGYFIASNGMSSIIVASNTIYGIKDNGFFRRRLKAIIMELIIVILILFIIIFPVLGNSIISVLHFLNLNNSTTELIVKIIEILKGPISWVIILISLHFIYSIAPDKKMTFRGVTGGALFTTLCWVMITKVYTYYIQHFANYSVFYGSLANIVALMTWIYFLSYVFVIGMAMNYHEELEKTGVIEVKKAIEESANSAPVMENITNNEPHEIQQIKKIVKKQVNKKKKNKAKETETETSSEDSSSNENIEKDNKSA